MQSCSLEITNYCNHHCLKCLHSKFNKMPRKLGMLSFDKWKYMIDHLYTYEYIGIGGAEKHIASSILQTLLIIFIVKIQ